MSESPPRLNLIQRAMQHAQGRTSEVISPGFLEEAPQAPPSATTATKVTEVVVAREPTEAIKRSTGLNEVNLNYARLRESKISLPGDRNSVTFNEFRSVKRKLIPLATRSGSEHRAKNIVMISSALPAEGKTFTSINLAITLAAEKNLNVILIDGDVIRSSVSRFFSGQSGRGLLDLFGDASCKVDDVLHRCKDIPNLHVLFSGTQNDSAPEMFASARMAEICDVLSKRFPQSIVVIDSPPVLATSEPTSLVTHIDHLIMVVAAGRASRHQVETALSALVSCRSIFLLFNKAPRWQRPSQGSYYYYGAPSP
jgi:protein-tyrosine kinase